MNNKAFFEPKVINEQSFSNIENQEELFILLDKLNKIVENHLSSVLLVILYH